MENISELKEKAYEIATDEYDYADEDRIEAMKAYALLAIAEKITTQN